MPNLVAYIALFAWVPVALVLFRLCRPPTAVAVTLLGALVLLPANFAVDLPGLPPIDRHMIGAVAALIGYLFMVPTRLRNRSGSTWPKYLIGVQVICTFITVSTNSDPLRYGGVTIPGLREYDALGVAFTRLVTIGVPFFLGMRIIKTYEDVLAVLRVIVFFGLVYLPLVLWEVRMSPQLHTTLYGYFPNIFALHLRAGGFRPVVFTSSGLELALFMATAVIASAGLMHTRLRMFGLPPIVPFLGLLVGLALCKGLGSLMYGILVPALILATKPAWQARVILLLSAVVLLYPLLRSQYLFPTETFVEGADVVSAERAHSLKFRFDNEDRLLDKASERPLFGWGTWGRNRVYDRTTGLDESITDGYWIIEMGTFGLTGFLSFFILLLAPMVLVARKLRVLPPGRPRVLIVTLALLVLIRAVDLIPNAFPAPFVLFLAGALVPFGKIALDRVIVRDQRPSISGANAS